MRARQGTKVPHNVYLVDEAWDHDKLVGQMQTPEIAEFIVECMNKVLDEIADKGPLAVKSDLNLEAIWYWLPKVTRKD